MRWSVRGVTLIGWDESIHWVDLGWTVKRSMGLTIRTEGLYVTDDFGDAVSLMDSQVCEQFLVYVNGG